MTFTFQCWLSVSWRWQMFRATRHHQNDRKCWQIWELIHEDHCQTIHELADTVGISYGVCQEILTENLYMRHIAAEFVSWLLTNGQKQRRIIMCIELWEKANEDPTFTCISWIITGGKILIYGNDSETKQQLSQCKSTQSPRAKKGQQVWSLFFKDCFLLFVYNEHI
jgi:hypothetical protein